MNKRMIINIMRMRIKNNSIFIRINIIRMVKIFNMLIWILILINILIKIIIIRINILFDDILIKL